MKYFLVNGYVKVFKDHCTEEFLKEKYPQYEFEEVRKPPTRRTIDRWISTGVAKATDGCKVEPDGVCPHGKESWLLVLGWI